MRRLERPTPPARIDAAREDGGQRLREWYVAPPRDRWNDKERGGESPIREALRAMSGDRCAWCEAPLGKSLEVEHYLPQEHFPWLRYCWANLLPACGPCNGAKLTWHPEALAGRPFIDPCLQGMREGEPYVPDAVLATIDDRLLEPTLDDPRAHLEFSPSDGTWRPRTRVGQRTAGKLFSDRSYNERIQKLSTIARECARAQTGEEVIQPMLDVIGHETVFRALLSYWQVFFRPAPSGA
jgi:uncharacterized protein (TIGR02646 family)